MYLKNPSVRVGNIAVCGIDGVYDRKLKNPMTVEDGSFCQYASYVNCNNELNVICKIDSYSMHPLLLACKQSRVIDLKNQFCMKEDRLRYSH